MDEYEEEFLNRWQAVYDIEYKRAYGAFDESKIEYGANVEIVMEYVDGDGVKVTTDMPHYPTLDEVDMMVHNNVGRHDMYIDELREVYADTVATEYADRHVNDSQYIEMFDRFKTAKPRKSKSRRKNR